MLLTVVYRDAKVSISDELTKIFSKIIFVFLKNICLLSMIVYPFILFCCLLYGIAISCQGRKRCKLSGTVPHWHRRMMFRYVVGQLYDVVVVFHVMLYVLQFVNYVPLRWLLPRN